MKGVRGLVGGTLVFALVCAMPAISLAQNGGPPDTTTTATTPEPAPQPPPEPAPAPDAGTGTDAGSSTAGASPSAPAAGAPREAAKDSGETTTDLRQESPGDAPAGGASKDSSAKAHKSASTTVTMGDFFFSPKTVTVSVGDLVTWRNDGKEPHTATADDGSFDTGTVPAGASGSHMFTKPGTFSYICTIHPNMKGTVRVLSSGGGGASGGASSSGSGQTEAQAVNSPNAAGDANTLPATGMAGGALALVGLALLGSGLAVRRSMRRLAGQQLSLF